MNIRPSSLAEVSTSGGTSGQRRMRVLLIAEAANPEFVSVPLVGWSHSRAIAARDDVKALLVTQVRNRGALLRAGLVEGEDADFIAIDTEHIARPLNRVAWLLRGGKGKGWTTVMAFAAASYYEFERQVWKRLGSRLRAGEFDLVHRLTPLSPTIPSLVLVKRCAELGLPFVLGPLNGGLPWPKSYDRVRRAEREWLSYLRGAYKAMPGYRATRKKSSAMLVASQATWGQLDPSCRDRCFYLPENAVDPQRFSLERTRRAGKPLKAVFLGRLVPYKGADVLIEAAAPLVRDGRMEVEIVGDGPQRPELEALIEREGVAGGVRLTGAVPHEQVQSRLVEADVFAFPSIREFGGGVVLEAMAVGLMPVVVGYGGPAELVTEQTGIAIPVAPHRELVVAFREALAGLAAHPEKVDACGAVARERVMKHFTWDAKAAQVAALYRWLLRPDECPRPACPMPIPD